MLSMFPWHPGVAFASPQALCVPAPCHCLVLSSSLSSHWRRETAHVKNYMEPPNAEDPNMELLVFLLCRRRHADNSSQPLSTASCLREISVLQTCACFRFIPHLFPKEPEVALGEILADRTVRAHDFSVIMASCLHSALPCPAVALPEVPESMLFFFF